MTSLARATYQFSASACADLVSRVPALEPALVRVGSRVWHWRRTGRFYRSVAGRYADRLRQSGSPFRRVMIGDVPLIVDVTEFTTSSLYFGNIPYEPKTTEYLRRHLQPGSVFADVGANHGYFTIIAAGLVGERGLVFAFEPNPPVYQRLSTHVTLNGFDRRVVLREQALWDSSGEETFFVSQWSRNNGISTLTPGVCHIANGGLSPDRTIRVRTETFDHWLATDGVERVDLVKVDAEGAEAHIVRGMSGGLRSGRIDAVVCETEWGSETHRLLCGFGLVPEPLDTNGPLTNIAYARPR
jgi:FkbM family methyltransferase